MLKFLLQRLSRVFLFCLFCITLFEGDFSLRAQNRISVLSWNLQNLGRTKSAETIHFIAKTVQPYDVIAIQEVVGQHGGVSAVSRLVAALNEVSSSSSWKSIVSNMTTGNTYQQERYAFIWNADRIHLTGQGWLDQNFAEEIEREPYLATFVSNRDTFTLVNFHAVPRKKQPEHEIKYLKFFPERYPYLRLLFVGDFNTPQQNNVFNPLKKMGYNAALRNQKTTMKMKCVDGECLASAYDNLFFNQRHMRLIRSGVIHFYRHYPNMVAARKVSDHLPVFLVFSMK